MPLLSVPEAEQESECAPEKKEGGGPRVGAAALGEVGAGLGAELVYEDVERADEAKAMPKVDEVLLSGS